MKRGDRVDSIGTCDFCGYYGPGPQHDCRLFPPAQRNLIVAALSCTTTREILIGVGHTEADIDAVLAKLGAA